MPEAALPGTPHGRVPNISFEVYKRQQARIARRRMLSFTIFYTSFFLAVAIFAFRSARPWVAAAFLFAGIPAWTLVEYLFHRFVLHKSFPPGKGIVRRFLHERLDPMHWEHHERPLDGRHISGELKDLLPLFFIAAPISFLFPVYTLPALLAGVVESYVAEEWMHYAMHFHNFRNGLFRRLKRHHLYHHSPQGEHLGYGITSGFWGFVFRTRYPASVRDSLFGRNRIEV